MVTNWKTYESQNRLLAAIVAAHPELKLNFKSIATHYTAYEPCTDSAVEHLFRPVKKEAVRLRAIVRNVDSGGTVGTSTPSSTPASTPKGRKRTAGGPAATPKGSTAKKIKKEMKMKPIRVEDSDDDSDSANYDALADSPQAVAQRKKTTHVNTQAMAELYATRGFGYYDAPVATAAAVQTPSLEHTAEKTPSDEGNATTPALFPPPSPTFFAHHDVGNAYGISQAASYSFTTDNNSKNDIGYTFGDLDGEV